MRPSLRAVDRACSSTKPPRAVFTRKAPEWHRVGGRVWNGVVGCGMGWEVERGLMIK